MAYYNPAKEDSSYVPPYSEYEGIFRKKVAEGIARMGISHTPPIGLVLSESPYNEMKIVRFAHRRLRNGRGSRRLYRGISKKRYTELMWMEIQRLCMPETAC